MRPVKTRAFMALFAHPCVENRSKLDEGLTDYPTNLNNSFGVVDGFFAGEGTCSKAPTRCD